MAEAAALLVDEGFPKQPVRQWVLSFPYPLRFLLPLRFRLRLMTFASLRFASRPEAIGRVLGIVYCVIATHVIRSAGFTRDSAHTGAWSDRACWSATPRTAGWPARTSTMTR